MTIISNLFTTLPALNLFEQIFGGLFKAGQGLLLKESHMCSVMEKIRGQNYEFLHPIFSKFRAFKVYIVWCILFFAKGCGRGGGGEGGCKLEN